MTTNWYHYFVYTIILSLLANCLPLPDDQLQPTPELINAEEGKYFEGDIRIKNQKLLKLQKRSNNLMQEDSANNETVISPGSLSGDLWPNGIVYFKFDEDLPQSYMPIFTEATNAWEYMTCIKFKEATSDQVAYLNFTNKEGCSSFIGRIGTMQEVSISSGCLKAGHAMHEIGHAIGLWHEHTRTDRDKYVRIVWDNIKDEYHHNFRIYDHPNVPDVGYDLQSVMHYTTSAFSNNRQETIQVIYSPLPSCINKIGQRDYISFKDALRVKKMYNCTIDQTKTDPCVLPEPSINPTLSTSASTITPTATSTPVTPTPPTCNQPKAVKSGNYVSFEFVDSAFAGLGCPSDCETRACSSKWEGFLRLHNCLEQYFVIYLASNRKNKYIKHGDTIALKSLKRLDHWIDCSRGNCTLTKCPDNTGKQSITNYTDDICNHHKYKIFATHPRKNKRIRDEDTFYIQAVDSDKFLNCHGKKCKLITEGSDCGELEYSGSSGAVCYRQYFKINKLNTCL